MLRHLALKDFAVVRSAELEFGPGMTVISGETGAGKSLLVDALGFLSGLRADSGVVRHGAGRAELSAEFSLDDAPPASAWLRENELDDETSCQLRRVIRMAALVALLGSVFAMQAGSTYYAMAAVLLAWGVLVGIVFGREIGRKR